MDQLFSYVSAAHPKRFTVLGMRLQPYCLGHAMVLQALDSPFLTKTRQASATDLLLGLAVCTRRGSQAADGVIHGARWRMALLGWQVRLMQRWRKHAVDAAIARFRDYIKTQSKLPSLGFPEGKGRTPGAPWLALLEMTLTAYLGYSETEAMDMPLELVHWRYCIYWEHKGALEITSAHDNALFAAARRENERLAREKAGK